MTTLNVAIPDTLMSYVDRRTKRGRYRSASAYVQALIQADAKQHAREELEKALLDGLKGKATPMTANDWDGLRAIARSYAKAAQR